MLILPNCSHSDNLNLLKMSHKLLFILLLVGLLAFKTTNAQAPPVTGMLTGLLGLALDVVVSVVGIVVGLLQALADGFAPKSDCGILNDGQKYYIQSIDGRYAVVDGTKKSAYLLQVPASEATQFTAKQKKCDVYGFCANGVCMSRCNGCPSDSQDAETISFHTTDSDGGYNHFKLALVGFTATRVQYSLQVDNGYYLAYKQTSNGDQITLSADLNDKTTTTFQLIAVR